MTTTKEKVPRELDPRNPRHRLAALFDEDMLGDDLEAWLAESFMMKRAFKGAAIIAGLIERRFPGEQQKTGRQITFSTDLIYDTLRRHQPDHLLLRCARDDAATGLIDVARLGQMLARIKGRIRHAPLEHLSPFSVPILLEIGKERAPGHTGETMILKEAEEQECRLIAMATHGRGGLGRAVLGSASDKVLRGTHLPLLLHRHRTSA